MALLGVAGIVVAQTAQVNKAVDLDLASQDLALALALGSEPVAAAPD